jgi:hypothetical protein
VKANCRYPNDLGEEGVDESLGKTKPIRDVQIASPACAGAGFAVLLAMTDERKEKIGRSRHDGAERQTCKTKPIGPGKEQMLNHVEKKGYERKMLIVPLKKQSQFAGRGRGVPAREWRAWSLRCQTRRVGGRAF